jgi:hypothetical protein
MSICTIIDGQRMVKMPCIHAATEGNRHLGLGPMPKWPNARMAWGRCPNGQMPEWLGADAQTRPSEFQMKSGKRQKRRRGRTRTGERGSEDADRRTRTGGGRENVRTGINHRRTAWGVQKDRRRQQAAGPAGRPPLKRA